MATHSMWVFICFGFLGRCVEVPQTRAGRHVLNRWLQHDSLASSEPEPALILFIRAFTDIASLWIIPHKSSMMTFSCIRLLSEPSMSIRISVHRSFESEMEKVFNYPTWYLLFNCIVLVFCFFCFAPVTGHRQHYRCFQLIYWKNIKFSDKQWLKLLIHLWLPFDKHQTQTNAFWWMEDICWICYVMPAQWADDDVAIETSGHKQMFVLYSTDDLWVTCHQ